jgi:type I restriction enzyme S subunit
MFAYKGELAMPKKKTALTIEERLQQALVPAEEQPYEVPENWVWTYISSGFDVTSSKRVHKSDWLSEGIPFYRTRELVKLSEQGYVDNELFISEDLYKTFKKEFGVPQKNDLLISGVGTIGVPYVISDEKEFYFKDGNVIWLKNKGVFDASYMYYLYKTVFIDNQIHSMSAGTTVDTYTIINAKNTIIPLPPLSEQQRIVERIEELFAKLDEAKERLQEVADSFAVRKAAILHKAFTGELTKQWRRENGVRDESWEEKKLGEVGVLERGRSKHRPRNDERLFGGIYPFIQTGDVANADMFIEKHSQTLSDFGMQQSKLFAKNTICITIAANIGKVAILSYDSCFPDSVVGLTTDEKNSYKYVYYYLSTQQKELESKAPATAQKNINLKVLNDLDIPLPSLSEQHEIVRLIDDLLARERAAQQATEQALASIELMKKSILARAFRGELGTNKASEASALELLRQVLAEN